MKLDLDPDNKYVWERKSLIFDKLGLTAEGKRAEKYAEGDNEKIEIFTVDH